ncbi:MAG: hypothetical protein E6640_01850 [Actinomyces urogenitalis]|uniref:hypothetical protein n=1 Tax=Actinomyces urogenitalis TaxID=103621 RepID=UPI0029073E02|nr:hypothetical protein [Actinomyces urogenitalis]MDU6150955.1 hypothetical protein [Actinomyces urogenitalis]
MLLDPQPGFGLLMPGLWGGVLERPTSVADVPERAQRLREASGLPETLVRSHLWASCAVPMLSPAEARLMPADPSVAGHPFFWLPDRLLGRYQIVDDELGVTTTESDDTWAVRLLLEAADSEWIDRETGQWIDVLEREGISRERVSNWVTGTRDPQLDDLAAPLSTDSDWAIEMAQQILPHLRAASDAIGAAEVRAAMVGAGPDAARKCALAGSGLGVVEAAPTRASLWQALYDNPADPQVRIAVGEYLDQLVEDGRFSLEQMADLFLSARAIA